MYEVFKDDNKKIIETGEILFANLKLSGQDKPLYFFDFQKIVKVILIKVEKVVRKL